jgi:hypothetical protein
MAEHIDTRNILSEENQQKLRELEKTRENHITRLFWLMIEIGFVFLIPAVLVVIVGGMFFEKHVVWLLLPFSFVFSWVIVIVRYRQLSKVLGDLDKQIKELRNPND